MYLQPQNTKGLTTLNKQTKRSHFDSLLTVPLHFQKPLHSSEPYQTLLSQQGIAQYQICREQSHQYQFLSHYERGYNYSSLDICDRKFISFVSVIPNISGLESTEFKISLRVLKFFDKPLVLQWKINKLGPDFLVSLFNLLIK